MIIDIAKIFASSEEQAEAFCAWAFGDNWKYVNGVMAVEKWNARHRDWFKLGKGGSLRDDIERMWQVFEFEEEKKLNKKLTIQ